MGAWVCKDVHRVTAHGYSGFEPQCLSDKNMHMCNTNHFGHILLQLSNFRHAVSASTPTHTSADAGEGLVKGRREGLS